MSNLLDRFFIFVYIYIHICNMHISNNSADVLIWAKKYKSFTSYFEYTSKTMNVVEVDVDFVGSISLYEFVKWGLLCDL